MYRITIGSKRTRKVPLVAPAIAPSAPRHWKYEFVTWDIVCESSSSITVMSEENRLRIRPNGVTSKKATGAAKVACKS